MHEVSIISNTLNIAFNCARENNLKEIKKIKLKIGELSGVQSDSLLFAYKNSIKDTIAQQAELSIEKVKAIAYCDKCEKEFGIDHFNKICPRCNEYSTNILSGYELNIISIEGE